MDTFTAIEQRRSIKHYDPDFQMPEAHIQQLMQLAAWSPTSFNIQNWRFVLVQNPDLRQQIRAASWDQAQVTEASLLVVLCGDLNAWDRQPERYWRDAPAPQRERIVPMIQGFYRDQPQLQRDEVMRSCGIAAQTLMLSAKALGYDSCPMVGFDPNAVADVIQLPEDHVIAMMLTIGKAAKPAWPRSGSLPLEAVWIRDRF
ncbi:MAG: nitroreductase family protein [Candidatus Melainabacteria bacterium]|nr:nitroreductase family protein [Candidatus Melainabacteria bacterium]